MGRARDELSIIGVYIGPAEAPHVEHVKATRQEANVIRVCSLTAHQLWPLTHRFRWHPQRFVVGAMEGHG
jgi:hypothetical protein